MNCISRWEKCISFVKKNKGIVFLIRAICWFLIGLLLELGTSIFVSKIMDSEIIQDSANVFVPVVYAIILIAYFIKARKVRPMLSLDNDMGAFATIIYMIIATFSDNFTATYITTPLLERIIDDNVLGWILGGGFLILGALLILVDRFLIDPLYEQQNENVKFKYDISDWIGEKYNNNSDYKNIFDNSIGKARRGLMARRAIGLVIMLGFSAITLVMIFML